ncbi:endolytic transglycosylase MltG [Flavihumibacter sp. CACIAM 22H1]|uniref:endolytic transglycosylase MltG n=1 Tax=Flavihumibacter sp. CACIAM 22H1 TaxID=1812911 RepID=UPI0007A8580D|nr:endolytic transglycosylase MltG [Flavihumibacter sp. CACIAM 22H1]KYP14481.1 MAG: hypothetical protein A1D16_21165 [Flavihumibacter sp. CACIAM 22H1]
MKKILVVLLGLLLIAVLAAFWIFSGPATAFDKKNYYLEIPTGSTYEDLLVTLRKDTVLRSPALFDFVAKRLGYPEKLKAGRYQVPKGTGLVALIRKLRNGQQEPVNLVINKLRTREDLAAMIGRKLEIDSADFMQYLLNPDSLQAWKLDSNTIIAAVIPNTYTYYWNTTPQRVMEKLLDARKNFWTAERKAKAQELGMSPEQVVTLASIVEEETNNNQEKDTIASVYLNRLKINMRLGADPTVKFALRDFSLKRIYHKHLAVESPYNTYRVTGLPPGPICTPQAVTVDAVLNPAATKYLYFVANPKFDGTHLFAENYKQHLANAKIYQQALDTYLKKKNSQEDKLD